MVVAITGTEGVDQNGTEARVGVPSQSAADRRRCDGVATHREGCPGQELPLEALVRWAVRWDCSPN
jgi:hypothetical protein